VAIVGIAKVVGAVVLVAGLSVVPGSAAAGLSADACALVPEGAASEVLGVTAGYVSQQAFGRRSCAWHSTDPNCFMRSLSVQQVRAAKPGAERWLAAELPDGSLFSNDVYPPGAAIAVQFLDIPFEDGWLHFSLLGRIDPITAQTMLASVAHTVLDAGRSG
jgi:hypothetical protein